VSARLGFIDLLLVCLLVLSGAVAGYVALDLVSAPATPVVEIGTPLLITHDAEVRP
jgi:hypothetical protein